MSSIVQGKESRGHDDRIVQNHIANQDKVSEKHNPTKFTISL